MLITGVASANFDLTPVFPSGPAGCSVLVLPLSEVLMPKSGTRFQSSLAMPIPNDVNLIGRVVYQQWAGLYFNCRRACRLGFVRMSDAAKLTVGR